MSIPSVFSFENAQVRALGTPDLPLFVAVDAAGALGYKDKTNAIKQHVDPEDLIKSEIETAGGRQVVNCVNESGLYALIFGSKLDTAKRFKRWVTSEVLPAIRRTGRYESAQSALITTTEQYELRQALEHKVRQDAPKIDFAEAVTASDAEHTITEASKTLGIRPKKFFDWLRANGFIYKQGTQAMQFSINKGLMVTRFHSFTHSDGEKDQKTHAHVTGKGIFYFYRRLLQEGLIARNPNLELTA